MEAVLHKAIDAYYNTLANYGYAKKGERERILLAVLITDYIVRDLDTMSDEEAQVFEQFYTCHFGKSCLLPYREWMKTHFLSDEEECVECTHRPTSNITPCTDGIDNSDPRLYQPLTRELTGDGFWSTEEEDPDTLRFQVAVVFNGDEHQDFITR